MDSELDNFKSWYADILVKLYPDRNSGFVILMIAFPLLERYLRNKNGLSPKDNLSDGCMNEVQRMFPALASIQYARKFWNIFRNGILHQVTLSRENSSGTVMPEAWLSHDIHSAVDIESDGSFIIHPVLFSKHVINKIENDFLTFKKGSNASTKLPKVKFHPTATYEEHGVQSVVLGTNTEE